MNIIEFPILKHNEMLADLLMELAEQARVGEIGSLVMFWSDVDGEYQSYSHCTLLEAIALTAMAHASAIDKIRLIE